MRSHLVLLFALALGAAAARPAAAQPSAAEIESAKKAAAVAANKAFDAFQAGKLGDAIEGFRAAEKAFHAPKFLLYIARAQVRLGRLVEAKTTYDTVVQEKLTTYAPPEFFEAQATAKRELKELTARIPTLQIQTKAGITAVTLDGRTAAVGAPLAVDPGDHVVTGSGPSLPAVTKTVRLEERETRTLTLEPPEAQSPPSPSTGPVPAPTSTPDTGPRASSGGIPAVTYVAYGVGAVGLVMVGVFGGLTLAKKADFNASAKGEHADAKKAFAAADQGEAFSYVADAGLATALVGAAVGTIFWLRSGPSKPEQGPAEQARSVFIAPRMGGMTVGGTF
jgi:hypothetical protein